MDELKIEDTEITVVINNNINNINNNSKPQEEENEFTNMQKTLTTIKTQLNTLQSSLKKVEKRIEKTRQEKPQAQQAQTKPKSMSIKDKKTSSGFEMNEQITDEMMLFMKLAESEKEISRQKVTSYIMEYIKTNKLQNKADRKYIIADDAIKALFKLSDNDELTYFNIQKYINMHFKSKSKMITIETILTED